MSINLKLYVFLDNLGLPVPADGHILPGWAGRRAAGKQECYLLYLELIYHSQLSSRLLNICLIFPLEIGISVFCLFNIKSSAHIYTCAS